MNITMLSKWAFIIKLMGLPFLIVADFNCEPNDLIEAMWPTRLGGHVVIPTHQHLVHLRQIGQAH
eukprot:1682667-Heterocapsa_arctica.AAC.1